MRDLNKLSAKQRRANRREPGVKALNKRIAEIEREAFGIWCWRKHKQTICFWLRVVKCFVLGRPMAMLDIQGPTLQRIRNFFISRLSPKER